MEEPGLAGDEHSALRQALVDDATLEEEDLVHGSLLEAEGRTKRESKVQDFYTRFTSRNGECMPYFGELSPGLFSFTLKTRDKYVSLYISHNEENLKIDEFLKKCSQAEKKTIPTKYIF